MATVSVRLRDFDRCCRCCLLMLGPMKPIFTSCLNGMFEEITGIQITQDDGLPQQMCSRCILKLSSAHNFFLTVKKNHKILELVLKEDVLNSSIESAKEENEELKLKMVSEESVSTTEDNSKSEPRTLFSSEPGDASEELSNTDESYHCLQCDYSASSQEDLQIHLQKHMLCKEEVPTEIDVLAHMCSKCGKRFRWRSSLWRHARRHGGGGAACALCGRRCGAPSALRVHLASHDPVGAKSHVCAVCGGRFSQRSALRRHARRHDPDAPRRRCPDCGKTFAVQQSLERHCARVHAVTQCSKCQQYFMGTNNLAVHLKTHEENTSKLPVESGDANKSTGNVLGDRVDVETVTVEFLCLLCGTRFQRKESLEAGWRLEWWHCGPVLLAVVMFLLVGTVMERYLEAALIRFLDRYFQPLPRSAEAEVTTEENCTAREQPREQPAPAASHKSLPNINQCTPKVSKLVERISIDLAHRVPEIDDI